MKLKATYETETFVNQRGYYAIRQEDWDGEPAVIQLTPDQMRLIIADMAEWLSTESSWFEQVESVEAE
jgi:hypothetical protein